jgi:hypothetical protein
MQLQFEDPPGYRDTIKALKEKKELEAIAAKEEALAKEQAKKKKPKGTTVYADPDLPSQFPVGSSVYLKAYTGTGFNWVGPYKVKSGISPKNKLIKIAHPFTNSYQFVSEHRLKRA